MSEHSRPFLTAHWRNLVILTYAVDARHLIDRVPAGTTLDYYRGRTFISLIGFQFLDTKVLGAPVPFHQDFEEVNLRFYVKRTTDSGVRPGVVFLCEVVPRPVVGGMARLLYREPYLVTPMRSTVTAAAPPAALYEWQMHGRWHSIAADAEPGAAGAPPAEGSLEEFITERHWGYNGEPGKDTLEYRVDHPRWRVWNATNLRINTDHDGLCGADVAQQLRNPVSALVAEGSAVTIHWRSQIEN